MSRPGSWIDNVRTTPYGSGGRYPTGHASKRPGDWIDNIRTDHYGSQTDPYSERMNPRDTYTPSTQTSRPKPICGIGRDWGW